MDTFERDLKTKNSKPSKMKEERNKKGTGTTYAPNKKCTCYCKRYNVVFGIQLYIAPDRQFHVIFDLKYDFFSMIFYCTLTSWDILQPCIWLVPHVKYSLASSVDSLSVSGADKYAPIVSDKCC